MESLGLCADSGRGREFVARRFGQGVRTRNRDVACDGSATCGGVDVNAACMIGSLAGSGVAFLVFVSGVDASCGACVVSAAF